MRDCSMTQHQFSLFINKEIPFGSIGFMGYTHQKWVRHMWQCWDTSHCTLLSLPLVPLWKAITSIYASFSLFICLVVGDVSRSRFWLDFLFIPLLFQSWRHFIIPFILIGISIWDITLEVRSLTSFGSLLNAFEGSPFYLIVLVLELCSYSWFGLFMGLFLLVLPSFPISFGLAACCPLKV